MNGDTLHLYVCPNTDCTEHGVDKTSNQQWPVDVICGVCGTVCDYRQETGEPT